MKSDHAYIHTCGLAGTVGKVYFLSFYVFKRELRAYGAFLVCFQTLKWDLLDLLDLLDLVLYVVVIIGNHSHQIQL